MAAIPETISEALSEALMLKGLSFGYSGPMTWWKSYSYLLDTKQGKVYFSSSSAKGDKENSWSFSGMEVPTSVLEDLSEMARAGGAVGSPKYEAPSKRVLDAHTYYYDLYWADGTHTGPGTAAGHIMNYLRILARQSARLALPSDPPPENTAKEIALLSKEEIAPPPTGESSDTAAQGKWTCSVCGGTESTEKFCRECGQPKAK